MTFLEWLYTNGYEHKSDGFIEGARVAYTELQEELEVMKKKVISLETIVKWVEDQ